MEKTPSCLLNNTSGRVREGNNQDLEKLPSFNNENKMASLVTRSTKF